MATCTRMMLPALAALGLKTDSRACGRILAHYDADWNGRLELSEFRALVHDLRAWHQHCNRVAAAPGA